LNKTSTPLQTSGGKDEPDIIFIWESHWAPQHRTKNEKTHNRTTQKTKKMRTRTPPKKTRYNGIDRFIYV